MLPFVSLSCSAQPPPLIVPLSVSPPMLPVDVTGRSEETLPNEVCAVRLYPSPCGICTRMDENEVFNRMSRQPLVGRLAVTAIPPFWLSTLIFPPIPSSVTPAKDVLTFASPFTFRSEEHTSELQSHSDLVCRLLLEKKKKTTLKYINTY